MHFCADHHIAGYALAGTPERTQILLAATQTPLLSDPKWGVKLLPELCKVVLHLPSQARQVRAAVLEQISKDLINVLQKAGNLLNKEPFYRSMREQLKATHVIDSTELTSPNKASQSFRCQCVSPSPQFLRLSILLVAGRLRAEEEL